MRSGLFLPLFDQLADPALVARLAGEAEEVGWHGVFVWDAVSVDRVRRLIRDGPFGRGEATRSAG
jgi:hypothetical protein